MTQRAPAQLLDQVFPGTGLGDGTGFGVAAPDKAPPPLGARWGGFSLVPVLNVDTGYDSAPGGGGSVLAGLTPDLTLRDDAAGFAAYGAAGLDSYPQDPRQNVTSYSIGAAQRTVLSRETVTIGGGLISGQQSGFTLDNIAGTKPVSYNARILRLRDDIHAAMFRFSPEISLTTLRFPGFSYQNQQNQRAGLTSFYQPGGPVRYVARLQATQLAYRDTRRDAMTTQILAGFEDTPDGLWSFEALAGAARRGPHRGAVIIAPIMEWRVDWLPTGLDEVRGEITHEIDNPDEVSAAPDILTETRLALTHAFSRDVSFRLGATISAARFIASPDRETLFGADLGWRWQLNPRLALKAAYVFNDRQTNFEAAADEHVVTAGLAWTP